MSTCAPSSINNIRFAFPQTITNSLGADRLIPEPILTHIALNTSCKTDLSDRNIMVDNGHTMSVIDWEMGAFFPEYWEYVRAQFAAHYDDYWKEVLLEVLEDKYKDMVKLEDHSDG
jgi:hypothetical protein